MDAQVWVGCMAHYNDGELIGEWVDAIDAADWVCPKADPNNIYINCEETWIYDHEIPGVNGEMDPMTARAWGELLASVEDYEADAFTAYLKFTDESDPNAIDLDTFRDAYAGEFDDIEALAWNYLDETSEGGTYEAPSGFRLEVDTVAWEQDFTIIDGHAFRNH